MLQLRFINVVFLVWYEAMSWNMSGVMTGGWKGSPGEEMEEAQRIHLCREALPYIYLLYFFRIVVFGYCYFRLPVIWIPLIFRHKVNSGIFALPETAIFPFVTSSHPIFGEIPLPSHGHFRNISSSNVNTLSVYSLLVYCHFNHMPFSAH